MENNACKTCKTIVKENDENDIIEDKKSGWYEKVKEFSNRFNTFFILIFGNIVILAILHLFIPDNNFLSLVFDNKSFVMLIIATIVMILMFPKFVFEVIEEIKNRSIGVMSVVSLSALIAYVLSLYLAINNFVNNTNFSLYFDAAVTIVVFLSLGTRIEMRITKKASFNILEILRLKNPKVLNKNGKIINLKDVKINDLIYINQNADILVDGIIVEGRTYVTESFLTGEVNHIYKNEGMFINAGSINVGKRILVKVIQTLEKSNIARIVKQSKRISENKPKIQKIADKIAKWLLLVEVLGAIGAFVYKYVGQDIELLDAFIWSLTVFVVICPCALGVLTPAVLMMSSSILNKRKILVKNSVIFNNAKKIKYAIFDKTGTVVSNKLVIENWKGDDKYLAIIKGMEAISEHPIAKSILDFKNIEPINDIKSEEILGIGLKTNYKGDEYYLGSKKLIDKYKLDYPNIKKGEVVLFKNKIVCASFTYQTRINPNVVSLVKKLKEKNIESILLSGDNKKNVELIANEVGFNSYYGEKSPEEKLAIVSKYKKTGKVIYIGDGINDVIALSNADISVSISTEFNTFNLPSDIIIFDDQVANIYPLLDIMKKTQIYILFGILYAILYNSIMLFSVIFLNVDPVLGAIIMSINDIFILFIVLAFKLLKLDKKDYYKEDKKK